MVGFILAICLTTLGLQILITVQILQVPFVAEFGAKKGEIIALFATGAAGKVIRRLNSHDNKPYSFQCTADILIAGFLCYYLLRDQSDFEVYAQTIRSSRWLAYI
jgi:hypothetical protein